MLKRVVSMLLVAALLVTSVPVKVFATEVNTVAYGDVNADGKIDLKDDLLLKRYIAGENPSGFNFRNADVNVDGVADINDLQMLKKYIAEWEIKLGADIYTVSFYDGDRLIDVLSAEHNSPLGEVPSVGKSSKENAILLGYYTDKDFTQPFYAENPVTENINVYAKYKEMGNAEELNFTSFAQMDQSSDISFEVECAGGSGTADEAVTLIVKDGSDSVELSITDEDGDGVYLIKAEDGFNEGCSYELTLAEGWNFKDKPETIRTAAFSIYMDEVEKLQMSDDIVYIQDTDSINYNVGGTEYEVLTSDILTENGGSFVFDGAAALKADDLLCIYVGVKPDERNPHVGSEVLDPAVYVKVGSVNGNTVSFKPLDAKDQQQLYNIPDNFPILVDALPTASTGSVNISALDAEMYANMMGEDGTYAKALENIEVGDFVTLYISQDNITSENDLYYGEITGYNSSTGEITYKETTRQTILDSMDLYARADIGGDDLITDEEKAELEAMLLSQVEQSDFAEDAAYMLADLVTKTDGFRNNMTIQEFLITDENGNELSADELQLLNLGGSFELSDEIELKIELITKGDQLHFGDGVQLAIGVDAGFEVEVEDEDKIAIDLSATFVQEVAIDPVVKGNIVYKEILWIPVPVGVKVGADIDIKSYTAFSFMAEVYTVAAEEKSTWDKLKAIADDPTEVLGLAGLPDELKSGLKDVGDIMDKIEELNNNIEKAVDTQEQLQGYAEDIEALWAVVEETGLTTREDWEQMEETLGKTSITSDLLGMLDMTTDTELSTEYLDSMQALLDRYSEMLEKDTDWVKLVDEEIFSVEVVYFGIAIGVKVDFIVRTDMSIAIGSNLEYEVGKRYSFWFKIGLFKPTAGNSSMDLIDERFAFQFYVMGRLGIKAGIQAKFYVGIGTGKFASVGITAELGPYLKLYGFFVYEYTKYRPAGTPSWTAKERMAGALYLEFGLYFMMGFEASALGDLFSYSYDFLDVEIPLLNAGESRYYYNTLYEPAEDEVVIVRDEDGNSSNGITMTLADEFRSLCYVDLDTGFMGNESLDYGRYNYTLSNPNFKFDETTGKISVTVPENTRYMECDMTITYLYGKLAFSQYDMSVTVPLVWTNLSTAELSEYYSASVRVGNIEDGYRTAWSLKVLKNKQYDLPTDEEIKEIIGWNEDKYIAGTGYGDQQTTGLVLIENEAYDYDVDYKTYSITVEDIQNTDGSTTSKTYYAKYGESFDFSDLAATGTNKAGEVYTKFTEVITDATIMVNGELEIIDLSRPINGKMAEALNAGVTARANYIDNSVTVIFSFTGLEHEDVTMKLGKGDEPQLNSIEAIASDAGVAIKDIYPAVGKVYSASSYQVVCGELTGPKATVSFEENGGTSVEDITKVVGSLIGTLPTPERTGYTFGGWYTDNDTFQNTLTSNKVPNDGITLYAKWVPNEYIVTFHVNGGDELAAEEQSKVVVYNETYGELPEPVRTGYGFNGWYTAAEGGTEIKSTDVAAITDAQTLYAQWKELKEIPNTIFDLGEAEIYTYEKGVGCEAAYVFTPEEGALYTADDFTFKYMRQGNTEYTEGLPINAGTYNVTISRPADNEYAKFEYTYTAVITINKAIRTIDQVVVEAVDKGYTFLDLTLVGDGGIDDLSEEATLTYMARRYSGGLIIGNDVYTSADNDSIIYNLDANAEYLILVKVSNDPNYEDAVAADGVIISTLTAPSNNWTDANNYDNSWYNDTDTSFTITTAAQLAGLSQLVSSGTDNFSGKTITLGADIDLRGHEWYPIGTSSNPFRGIFDGANHTVSGLYCVVDSANVGLFGYIYEALIQNVLVDDAYFSGTLNVGGIVGYIYESVVYCCISYAVVIGTGNGEDANVGGITGYVYGPDLYSEIWYCVNYGRINAGANHAGGIAGYGVDAASVVSCANFGDIKGVSCVGGIIGETNGSETEVANCFSVGTVYGTEYYIGAIDGRNNGNDGFVECCYYLQGSATCNGEARTALGTKKGALTDGDKSTECAYFTSPTSSISRDCGMGRTDLITVLNVYNEYGEWDGYIWVPDGPDGYPVLKDSAVRK